MIYQAKRNIKVQGKTIKAGQQVEVLPSIGLSAEVKLYQIITSTFRFVTPESHLKAYFKTI